MTDEDTLEVNLTNMRTGETSSSRSMECEDTTSRPGRRRTHIDKEEFDRYKVGIAALCEILLVDVGEEYEANNLPEWLVMYNTDPETKMPQYN